MNVAWTGSLNVKPNSLDLDLSCYSCYLLHKIKQGIFISICIALVDLCSCTEPSYYAQVDGYALHISRKGV